MKQIIKFVAGLCTVLVLAVVPVACGDGSTGQLAVGTLERDRIELVSEAFEPVVEVLVKEGDEVSRGEVLLRLDTRRANILLDAARAEEEHAAAFVTELEKGPRSERLEAARATLKGAQQTVAEARRALLRTEALLKDNNVSEARRDAASLQVDQAVAAHGAAKAILAELEEGTRSEVLDQARAALKRAALGVKEAQLHMSRHTITAPVAGRIEALPYEIGERPLVGKALAVMLATGAPYARIYIPSALRANLKPGAIAHVEVTGIKGTFEGRLRYVSSDAAFTPFFALTEHDRGKLSYLADVDLTGAEAMELPTGLPVEVFFEVEAAK